MLITKGQRIVFFFTLGRGGPRGDQNGEGGSVDLVGFLAGVKASSSCSNSSLIFVRYAPSKRWHIDTIMRVLTTVSKIACLGCLCENS